MIVRYPSSERKHVYKVVGTTKRKKLEKTRQNTPKKGEVNCAKKIGVR